MTEEQLLFITKKLVEANELSTKAIVKETVNGKIDALALKVDANHEFIQAHAKEDKDFQDKMEPYLQGAAGLKIFRDLAVWVAGGLAAFVVIKGYFK